MIPQGLMERLDALTEEILRQDGVESACVGSILLRLRQAVAEGWVVQLCCQVWKAEADPAVRAVRVEAELPRAGPTGPS